jgi:hypothetical protein
LNSCLHRRAHVKDPTLYFRSDAVDTCFMKHVRLPRWLLALSGIVALACTGTARAGSEPDCQGDGPLRTIEAGTVSVPSGAVKLGEWTLPISAERPDVMTHAQVALSFERGASGSDLRARVSLSFPDPMPYGIPFTFYGYELRWIEPTGSHAVMQDWTSQCQEPGPSLFPGQAREFTIELPGSAAVSDLEHLEFRIWGSRN